MSQDKIVCTAGPKNHIVLVVQAVITRCATGCGFMAVGCFDHNGFAYGERKHAEHMMHVRDHARAHAVVAQVPPVV